MSESIIKVSQQRLLEKRLLETIKALSANDKNRIRNIFKCMRPDESSTILELLTTQQQKMVIEMLGMHLDPKIIFLLDPSAKQMALESLKFYDKSHLEEDISREDKIERIAYQVIKIISDTNLTQKIWQSSIKNLIIDLQPADLASVLELLNIGQIMSCIDILGYNFNPVTLTFLNAVIKEKVLLSMSRNLLETCIISMSKSDIVELIEDLDKTDIRYILNIAERVCDAQKIEDIYQSMRYDEDKAGRIMLPGIVLYARQSIREGYTKLQSMIESRKYNDVVYLYDYVDGYQKIVGQIRIASLITLFVSKKHKFDNLYNHLDQIECMLYTDTPFTEVAFLFKEYSVMQMPVINRNTHKLMGVINASQAIDILGREEGSLSLVGIEEYDFHESLWDSMKLRMSWMTWSSLASMFSALIIHLFSGTIERHIHLAQIMSLAPAIAGSSVSQVLTVTVRAISNQEINFLNLYRTLHKEMLLGLLLGLAIGIIVSLLLATLARSFIVVPILTLSLTINMTMAGFLGTFIPVLLHKYGIDAAAASTFLNACTDIIGYCCLFTLANILLT